MIIMGYPGIGKTTLAQKSTKRVIDLESSLFKKNYTQYVQVAYSLHKQGYCVFVSTHIEVGEELKKLKKEDPELSVGVVYPKRELKDLWIQKLKQRAETSLKDKIMPISEIDKNLRAYQHCSENFISDIWYIEEGGYPDFELMPIENMDYILYYPKQ